MTEKRRKLKQFCSSLAEDFPVTDIGLSVYMPVLRNVSWPGQRGICAGPAACHSSRPDRPQTVTCYENFYKLFYILDNETGLWYYNRDVIIS